MRTVNSLIGSPMSRIIFVQKRVYNRCMTACSMPPMY